MSEIVGSVDPELAGWYLESVLTGELFTISRNWLNPGRGSLSRLSQVLVVNTSEIEKIKDTVNTVSRTQMDRLALEGKGLLVLSKAACRCRCV